MKEILALRTAYRDIQAALVAWAETPFVPSEQKEMHEASKYVLNEMVVHQTEPVARLSALKAAIKFLMAKN